MIKITNLCKKYGKNEVITNLNLLINDGEFLVVLGPSGCGKTTLLRIIAGLEEVTSGEIIVNDRKFNELSSKERNISMVFQNNALLPNMNVFQNISFGLKVRKYKKEQIKEIVSDIAIKLKIENLLKRKPDTLSGGEQERVAIARAMVKKPTMYLFDEPLASLDVNLKDDLKQLIKEIHKETNTTFIYVTHDQSEALSLADRIVVMNKGEILQVDTPYKIYNQPESVFTAKFLGEPKINILKIVNSDIKCGIRPEYINKEFNSCEEIIELKGKVINQEFVGNGYIIDVNIGDQIIKVKTISSCENDKFILKISKTDMLFFNNEENLIRIDLNKLIVNNNKLFLEK